MSETAAIVLAAGKSVRMKSDLPKVLHEICGRPMLSYVLNACRLAGVDRTVVVVGHGKDRVIEAVGEGADVTWVEQAKQKGTGHAVLCCRNELSDFSGSVLVIAGDMPLVQRKTLANLLQTRERRGDALTLATAVLEDPTGYGRIVRDSDGQLEAIVEHNDCTDQQRDINEVNPSYYCFDAEPMFEALDKIKKNAGSGELYLTDAVEILRTSGAGVSAVVSVAPEEAIGVNSRLDLATVARRMQDRIQLALLNDGVSIVDPDNTWIESDVTIGRDTTVHPFTVIGTGASIGEGCHIGPLTTIGPGETVPEQATVGPAGSTGAQAL